MAARGVDPARAHEERVAELERALRAEDERLERIEAAKSPEELQRALRRTSERNQASPAPRLPRPPLDASPRGARRPWTAAPAGGPAGIRSRCRAAHRPAARQPVDLAGHGPAEHRRTIRLLNTSHGWGCTPSERRSLARVGASLAAGRPCARRSGR